jgi:amino acid transporter
MSTASVDMTRDIKDIAQLAALGVTTKFDRSMSVWQNFALGFTYLSPVVGVYTLFGLCLTAGGPPMFWTYLIIGMCQMLVCLVFCEVVSQFPISGGIYPWARRLVGKRWAWMAGWIYAWAVCTSIAGIAVGSSPYLAAMIGVESSSMVGVATALVLILSTTILNLEGTKWLARVAMFGFLCELIGSLLVGGYLLIFERQQSFGVLFNTFNINLEGSYWPAFLAASLGGMFQYYGFEACGDVAEETPNPSYMIPKAMRMTIYIGGAAAMFACLTLILSVPDMQKVLAGEDTDPIVTIFSNAFGPVVSKLIMGVVMVSFLSCLLSLQAAGSRLLHAYGRDEMIVGGARLSRMSSRTHVPFIAVLAVATFTSAIIIAGYWMEDAIATIVSFAAVGIYLAFQMIVIAALIARMRGWKPSGAFRLGVWAWPVNIGALVYGVGAIVNMVWPRSPDAPWFINYGMVISSVAVIGSGLLYMWLAKPYGKCHAPAGDAHLLFPDKEAGSDLSSGPVAVGA